MRTTRALDLMHEMQIPLLETERNYGSQSTIQVREMFAVSYTETILLGLTVPTGSPAKYVKIVLDTHPRRRLPDGRVGRNENQDNEKLLRRLAAVRAPGRKYTDDPLLWLLRVRWAVRTATLALSNLQSNGELPGTYEVPSWYAETTNIYYAMASWAHRCGGIQFGDNSLCRRIHNGFYVSKDLGSFYKPGTAPYNQACNWLFWSAAASSRLRQTAFDYLRDTYNFYDWQ